MAILEEETHKKFGYYPRDLSSGSHKRIIVKCDECGKVKESEKKQYRALCRSCTMRGNRNPMYGISLRGEEHHNWQGGPVERRCIKCGKIFLVSQYKVKNGKGLFCSRECYALAQSENSNGKNNPNWHGGRIQRICQKCGKVFKVNPSVIKAGNGKFCSQKCARSARITKQETRDKISIAGKGKIVSETTRKKISDTHKGEKNWAWKGGLTKCTCEVCRKIFEIPPSLIKKGRRKYCSRKCMGAANTGKKNPNWKNGASFEPYCYKFNEQFKQYIRTKFGNVCFLCGKTEEENGKHLCVHHVDYRKSCGCVNTKEEKKSDDSSCQFVPLCISCNSKVNFNRDLWERRIKNEMKNKLNGWYI